MEVGSPSFLLQLLLCLSPGVGLGVDLSPHHERLKETSHHGLAY